MSHRYDKQGMQTSWLNHLGRGEENVEDQRGEKVMWGIKISSAKSLWEWGVYRIFQGYVTVL